MVAQGVRPDRFTCNALVKMIQNRTTSSTRLEDVMMMIDVAEASLPNECRKTLLDATFSGAVRMGRSKLATRAFLMLRQLSVAPCADDVHAFAKLRSRMCGPIIDDRDLEDFEANALLAMLDRGVSL